MFNPFDNLTVSSVYQKFTKDLQKVAEQQQAIITREMQKQEELSLQLQESEANKDNADKEVSMANAAIENIGKLLGIFAN